jgi:hypothetical protein
MRCVYEYWSNRRKRLVHCGKPAVMTDHGQLCAEHGQFVDDCHGLFSKSKRAHPADRSESAWLKAAKKAYGCRGGWSPGAFPLGKPEDAGADYICGRRVGGKKRQKAVNDEVDELLVRRVLDLSRQVQDLMRRVG